MNRRGAIGIGIIGNGIIGIGVRSLSSFADTTVLSIGSRDPLAAMVDR